VNRVNKNLFTHLIFVFFIKSIVNKEKSPVFVGTVFAIYKYIKALQELYKKRKRGIIIMFILEQIDAFFANIVPIGDFLWIFPMNFEWYANIPILGQIPFAIFLLVGMGFYFTFKMKGVQFRYFKAGIQTLTRKKKGNVGVSQLAAFMLSTAERVGPGNIIGVTGAISLGGPGALFWMWVSATVGMASSFVESTLSQIFKQRDGDDYVGGLPFYGERIFNNKKWVGSFLSVMFIAYAMLCIPIQTFHVFTATGTAASIVAGVTVKTQSVLYYAIAVLVIVGIAATIFGGIKRVTRITDFMVPIMAVIYGVIVIVIVIINIGKVPAFLYAVVAGAFNPESIFGGSFGIVLSQGIKRGLLSNEAGQGTVTMAAAISEANHPCEQGFIQSIGVFLDTIIICTMSGFIVGAAKIWNNSSYDFITLKDSKIDLYLTSLKEMIPGAAMDSCISVIICICYALFAFTSLLGLISFAIVAGTKISKSKKYINTVRILGAFVFVPIGTLCVLAGLQLDNIWYVSDLLNIVLVFANAPILFYGSKYVVRALKNYADGNGERFVSSEIGVESDIWTYEERERMKDL